MSIHWADGEGGYLLDDRYDLSVFSDAPSIGPYSSRPEAEEAEELIEHLVSGACPD